MDAFRYYLDYLLCTSLDSLRDINVRCSQMERSTVELTS